MNGVHEERITFADRRRTDPQGVIDDLLAQTTRQGKAIFELNHRLENQRKVIEQQKKLIDEVTEF